MKWEKLGLVYAPDGNSPWWKTHCMAPSAILLNENIIRVFVGGWDSSKISRIGFVDVEAKNPLKVIAVSESPVVDLGLEGTFDDNGVFPGHVSKFGAKFYLYYTGFQLQTKIPFTNFGGVAVAEESKPEAFIKSGHVPVLDRSENGLCVRSGQTVLFEDGKYKTWYSAGKDWEKVGGKLRQTYDVYYSESDSPLEFGRSEVLCFARDQKVEHGLGRPQVIKVGNIYKMFYTRRILNMKYTIGYAVSHDGINWERKDDSIGIEHSAGGWDSDMVYFPSVLQVGDEFYLFYTGNNFGESGFGAARLVKWD